MEFNDQVVMLAGAAMFLVGALLFFFGGRKKALTREAACQTTYQIVKCCKCGTENKVPTSSERFFAC